MATAAQYTLKTYLEALWAPYSVSMVPGKYIPGDQVGADMVVAYSVIPNRNYLMPYIHEDNMQIRIYHKNYNTISNIINDALDALNRENARMDLDTHDDTLVFTTFRDAGFTLNETSCRASSIDQNEFIEGTEYFFATIDIMYEYVVGV